MVIRRTIRSAVVFAALTLIQSTATAEEPWRFIAMADWHMAAIYVQSRYPGAEEATIANLKMLKAQYGGELVMLSGDSNVRHWDRKNFIESFKLRPSDRPTLTEGLSKGGNHCRKEGEAWVRYTGPWGADVQREHPRTTAQICGTDEDGFSLPSGQRNGWSFSLHDGTREQVLREEPPDGKLMPHACNLNQSGHRDY